MPEILRELDPSDRDQVNLLCETIWEGNDYVPFAFPEWVSNPDSHMLGMFLDDELIAIGTLEKTEDTSIAWIQGLRVKNGFRERGYGKRITAALTLKARELGIKTIWYATSSKNIASMSVASKTGFHEAAKTGYFRLYSPFPAHSKPSERIIPIEVNPERLYELLDINPDLVPSDKFPLAWHFDLKTMEGLTRLLDESVNKVIIDDAGIPQAVYCCAKREERDNEKTLAYTVFANDRAIFVDIMSRMIDESEEAAADRAIFFLGPRVTEWAQDLGYVTEEFNGRRFLLYEMILT